MNSKEAFDSFQAFAENFFLQRKSIRTITDTLVEEMYGGKVRLDPYETEAIAAVAATACTNGDLDLLAQQLSNGARWFSDDDLRLLARTSRKVLGHPDFVNQLYNGDARPIIEETLIKVRESQK